MTKRHLSFTQISMFLRCPRQYEYRYVQGIKSPPSGALILGRCWHETLDKNYRQKIESDRDLPLGEMQDLFAADFDQVMANEDVRLQPWEKPGPLKDLGVAVNPQGTLFTERFRGASRRTYPVAGCRVGVAWRTGDLLLRQTVPERDPPAVSGDGCLLRARA